MYLITNKDRFDQLYGNGYINALTDHLYTIDILEYYIETYEDVNWQLISYYQPLTTDFINKYSSKLDWFNLIRNPHLNISYELLEKNVYSFNLYEVYTSELRDKQHPITKIVTNYTDKFNLDKLSYELNNN